MKTLRFFLITALFLVAGIPCVRAGDTGNTPDTSKGVAHVGTHPGTPDGREGGENVATATPIVLPFYDTGNTCDNLDDYDEVCPYSGSTSPDVVYSFTPTYDQLMAIDLCSSLYDTKVYVYCGSPGILVACNDDAGCGYSGWQSRIEALHLIAGLTYYIVIDGYGGDCGDYLLQIDAYAPCAVECPPGGEAEGEPPLQDGYVDLFNGGCNSPPTYPFQALEANDPGFCLTFCGRSGTYLYQGMNYRDTDWFEVTAVGNLIEWTLDAEAQVYGFQLSTGDCDNVSVIQQMTAGPCNPAYLAINTTPGQLHWLWVGPTVFSGLPEFTYVMTICGIYSPISTENTSWGHVKELYR